MATRSSKRRAEEQPTAAAAGPSAAGAKNSKISAKAAEQQLAKSHRGSKKLTAEPKQPEAESESEEELDAAEEERDADAAAQQEDLNFGSSANIGISASNETCGVVIIVPATQAGYIYNLKTQELLPDPNPEYSMQTSVYGPEGQSLTFNRVMLGRRPCVDNMWVYPGDNPKRLIANPMVRKLADAPYCNVRFIQMLGNSVMLVRRLCRKTIQSQKFYIFFLSA